MVTIREYVSTVQWLAENPILGQLYLGICLSLLTNLLDNKTFYNNHLLRIKECFEPIGR